MADDMFTQQFLEAVQRYLSDDSASLKACGGPLKLHENTFLHRIRAAYQAGYIVVHSKLNEELAERLRREWYRKAGIPNLETFVASGMPDDVSFARSAAEYFAKELQKTLLLPKETINIGIVSGLSTGLVIDQLVHSRLWEERLGHVDVKDKTINVLALNVTPVIGFELEGNANLTVLRLALMLRAKLKECTIMPLGLSAPLVVAREGLRAVDESPYTRRVVEIADPSRLGINEASGLDLVITGVGAMGPKESSVFLQVLHDEKLSYPSEMVGDVSFSPVSKDGEELSLTRAPAKGARGKGEPCVVYSAIGLKTLASIVNSDSGQVILVARNRRPGAKVNVSKLAAIEAALKGKYINHLVTDTHTAEQLVKPASS